MRTVFRPEGATFVQVTLPGAASGVSRSVLTMSPSGELIPSPVQSIRALLTSVTVMFTVAFAVCPCVSVRR